MARLLRADGTEHTITPKDPHRGFTLGELQALVGGDIEPVYYAVDIQRPYLMIVDEDGRRKQRPLNRIATRLYQGTPAQHDETIVGDALICRVTNAGETTERWE